MMPGAAGQVRHPILAGRRVLVAEDEFLIGMTLEGALEAQGCLVLGPVGRLPAALQLAERERVDLAVLDVNLMGVKAYPLAYLLEARRIPFVLATGYGEAGVPPDRPGWTVCSKPYRTAEIMMILARLAAAA